MNVIFLDFDGVLDTFHYSSKEDMERRIKILGDICSEYDSKVVIEASMKSAIDEETGEVYSSWVQYILDCFVKYNIDCIGKTPNVKRIQSEHSYIEMWKEDEIRLYLFNHPEIDHYCVIDDNDFMDLEKVKPHLVETIYYSKTNPEEEGLLEKHKKEVGEKLKIENEIQKFAIKKAKKRQKAMEILN